jgi:hypothetical protein
MRFAFWLILVGSGTFPGIAQEAGWPEKLKQLKVLRSTRADVERELGNPTVVRVTDKSTSERRGWGLSVSYETLWGDLDAEYSTGNCSESGNSDFAYDVAEGVLVNFTFWPVDQKSIRELIINVKSKKHEVSSDVEGLSVYYDFKKGHRFNVKSEKVTTVEYFLPASDSSKLRCKSSPAKARSQTDI